MAKEPILEELGLSALLRVEGLVWGRRGYGWGQMGGVRAGRLEFMRKKEECEEKCGD